MKRLIIIPDVHGRDFWRKAVSENPDGEFVFLGDYLDPYDFEDIVEDEDFHGLEDIIRFKEEHPDCRLILVSLDPISRKSGDTELIYVLDFLKLLWNCQIF